MNATLLLPELGPASEQVYSWFNVILLMTLFSKLIAVVLRIIEQSTMDIYLVDFENPNRDSKQVNAWRYMFIPNEFAELQTSMRYINLESMIFWFCFFWIALGWKNYSETDPTNSTESDPIFMENVILKFFISAILMQSICAV